MAETDTASALTPEERDELEALREEKARREAEAAAAAERAELEALRAEQRRVDEEILAERAAQAAPAPAPEPAAPVAPAAEPAPRTFGQKMVMAPEAADPDDIPGMAPAQKIIIALAAVAVIVLAVYIATQG